MTFICVLSSNKSSSSVDSGEHISFRNRYNDSGIIFAASSDLISPVNLTLWIFLYAN